MSNNNSKRAPAQSTPPVLLAARTYVRLGWQVFPVQPGTRRPILSERSTGRRRGASSDSTVVEQMFRDHPFADIGVVTGEASGIWVLDIDNKKSKDGYTALDALEFEHRDSRGGRIPLPLTAIAASPSGGAHYYFTHPGRSVRTSASRLGPGLDVLGEGANAIVPPSRGRSWGIGGVSRITAAPSWLLALVCEERPTRPPRSPRSPSCEPQRYLGPVPSQDMIGLMTRDAGRGLSLEPDNLQLPEDTELKIQFALSVIPRQDYHEWVRIGGMIACALRGVAEDDGRGLWEDWADEVNAAKWSECMTFSAFDSDGRSIFRLADMADPDRGWRRAYQIALANAHKRGAV